MDPSNVHDFELLLRKQRFKKPSALYNKVVTNHTTYKPQDVIDTVYSQVKAIHMADCLKNVQIGNKDLNKVNKTDFLTVNKLPVYHEVSKQNTNKFETQCVSDTQLIYIMEGAEAIDTHMGMDQEFNTTFAHIEEKITGKGNVKETGHNIVGNDLISSLNVEPPKVSQTTQRDDKTITNDHIISVIEPNINETQNTTKINSQLSRTATEDTITLIDDQIIRSSDEEIKDILSGDSCMGQFNQGSPSPVLNMKTLKRKAKSPLPLVVSLESFENFENIAIPLIDRSADFEAAKYLINSQILHKELCLNTNSDTYGVERNYSPILEFKSAELQVKSQDVITPNVRKILDDIVALHDNKNEAEKRSDSLEDEILFSSDEENDYVQKEMQDLPLTCALETSFYDQSGVLEKTMFVGFQTASNKSIQISTDSFDKAKSILENENRTVTEFSLTELVEKCDNSKHEKNIVSPAKVVPIKETVKTRAEELKTELVNSKNNLIKTQYNEYTKACSVHGDTELSQPEKHIFEGFITASCKKIEMSDNALQKSLKVFKDINLNENFDAMQVNTDIHIQTKVTNVAETTCKIDNGVDTNENIIGEKINDELLLQEFENIEMSLEEKVSKAIEKENVSFEGFKTASNKNILISTEAMAKIKSIFQDFDVGLDTVGSTPVKEISSLIKNPSIASENVSGFKTAGDRIISISSQAIDKTKKLVHDSEMAENNSAEKVDTQSLETRLETIEDINQPSNSKAVFIGFKTANNIEIKISDKALSKSKEIFKDLDKIKSDTEMIEKVTLLSKGGSGFAGFRTANNKDIKLSDDALTKSKEVFKNIDKEVPTNTKTKDEEAFRKLKTASNKRVTITEQALIKSGKKFQDFEMNENMAEDNIELTEKNLKDESPIFKGFQTASKKPVNVSAEALAKSKKIFQDIDKVGKISKKDPKSISNIEFKGFQTANKNRVEVSKESVIASKKFLENSNDAGIEHSGCHFVGFKTANDKNVDISAEAIAKCKKIFNDIEDIPINEQILLKSKTNEHIFGGFQTANNKGVDVSKEALEKTKKLLEDVDSFPIKETIGNFTGFQTANKKKVTVSEQALAKSRRLMRDLDLENNMNIKKKDCGLLDGNISVNIEVNDHSKDLNIFKNRDSVKIKVSEDNLSKSKVLFDEDIIPGNNKGTVTSETKQNNGEKIEFLNDNSTNIDGILNTQVLNNLEVNLCTQDFKDTPRPNKRSGSPILSCPRAKKRKKFETPYKNVSTTVNFTKDVNEVKKADNIVTTTFKEDYKKNKKYTLKDLMKCEIRDEIIDPYILNFNLENILHFEFNRERNDLSEGKITTEEIKQLFTEGTDKKLIPDGWLDIQLKLILWKLISYEIKFKNILGLVCTAKNVMDQLKYRYDKELYNAERPILRKILEKDDVPTKPMVLCVAGIYVDGVSVASATTLANIELLLTDGWYFIRATIDKMLSKLVYDGKMAVGIKIVTCGAELMNCEQGVSPWEDISSIRLHLSGNSTRKAPWDARLGLCTAAILNHLSSVKVDGGKICRLRAVVARVYPMLYVEKFEDGSTVTRSERLEHLQQMRHEAERESIIEKMYEEVERTFSEQESQESESLSDSENKRKAYESGSQIAKMMKRSKDPMEFRAQLSSTQVQLLQNHASLERDKYLQAVQDKIQERLRQRNVVGLARARIAALEREGDKVVVTKGMLSIWKPNDAVLDIFKENSWIEITNLVPTALRNSEIQLSAGRQSVFRPLKTRDDETLKPYLESLKRICYDIKDLSQNPSLASDYNEIDTVGIIFSIEPSNCDFEPNKNHFQNIYLSDIDKNMVCVNFWGGLKKFGYENILDTGQVIFCGNMQKRAGNTRKTIPQYRATEFTLFTKTPKSDKARRMVEELNKKLLGLDRRKFCDDCVAIKQNYSVIKCFDDSENVSPYRFNRSDYNLGKNCMFIETPVCVKAKCKTDKFNLTGLDFESSFRQRESEELSPKSLLRKRKVNEKIAKLKMYGEPPPLSPINVINKSKSAANSYKNPLLHDVASTHISEANNTMQNVATPRKSPEICGETNLSSPIVNMNRTYVKRVNPVKLNFSGVAMEQNDIDHFAEEFDGSPPLSLD